jgi:acyl-ACP thioesterase
MKTFSYKKLRSNGNQIQTLKFVFRFDHIKANKSKLINNAKYWQKMRDFIGLYHFDVIIQL